MEELKTNTVEEFTLPNDIVIVKFIPRKKGMAANVPDNHIMAGGMMPKSIIKYAAPLQKNGAIANILTSTEKQYLEKVTGLNLSVYGDFFKNFFVSLFKDDASNKFDLSEPLDYISYKILSVCPEVAPDWEARKLNPEYRFAITREGEVQDEKKKALDVKKEAFKAYGRIEDNQEKLVSVLKLLTNKIVASTSKIAWLQGQIELIIDEEPQKFLNVIQDPHFETKALINRGVEAKVILKEGNLYVTNDGIQLCEAGSTATFANAVRYLNDDKNQELRLLLEARIDKA
jgi:hypothetical protein